MKKMNKIVSAAAAAALTLTGVSAFAADTAPVKEHGFCPDFTMTEETKSEMLDKVKAELEEKLTAGEITQEQYDEITAGFESGNFGGFGGRGMFAKGGTAPELTDEQKAELEEKIASGEFDSFGGRGMFGKGGAVSEMTEETKSEMLDKVKAELEEKLTAGEITQEQYDEIVAGIESGFSGGFGRRGMFGKGGAAPEMTDEQKAELEEKIASGEFGGFSGRGMFGRSNKTE